MIRGEIWLVNLDPLIVAPMSTKSRAAPFRIGATHGGKKGLTLRDQMRAVDKVRLVKKLGALPPRTLTAALTTLQEVFTESAQNAVPVFHEQFRTENKGLPACPGTGGCTMKLSAGANWLRSAKRSLTFPGQFCFSATLARLHFVPATPTIST